MVLLDMLASQYETDELIVAHFEHGIRGEDSEADARFVEKLSQKYRLKCEIGHGNLTKSTSEADARYARYEFLRAVAKKYGGVIVTAHHQDDLIETIALNVWRGTGWRGLAVFGSSDVERPLFHMTKKDIYNYAADHNLEWVEDETNQTDIYTRNQLRRVLWHLTDSERGQLLKLYEHQRDLRAEIDVELSRLSDIVRSRRYFMIMVSENVACELLRYLTDSRLTRPQLERLLLAIKTFRPGSQVQVGGGLLIRLTLQEFSLESIWSD